MFEMGFDFRTSETLGVQQRAALCCPEPYLFHFCGGSHLWTVKWIG